MDTPSPDDISGMSRDAAKVPIPTRRQRLLYLASLFYFPWFFLWFGFCGIFWHYLLPALSPWPEVQQIALLTGLFLAGMVLLLGIALFLTVAALRPPKRSP